MEIKEKDQIPLLDDGKRLRFKQVNDSLCHEACDEMQGFYFSKPIESVEFEKLFHSHEPIVSA